MISCFQAVKNCYHFVSCREFWHQTPSEGSFEYEKNWAERWGDAMVRPVFKNTDTALRHIREPYMITALTLAAIGMVTLVFYPEKCGEFLTDTLPIGDYIKPWMIKFGVYLGTEAVILGAGLRTFGRYDNQELIDAWREKRILAIPMGTVIENGF